MPSPFTSSFASAAAGNMPTEGGPNGRNTGSGDWTRARTNGATQTFRRPSVATNLSQQKESSQSNINSTPSSANVYVPPHMNSSYQSSYNRNGSSTESRYSKDQLLDLFRTQERNGFSSTNVNELFVDGWSPGAVNGTSNGGWGKRDDNKDAVGPDICWDHEGSVGPMALQEMSEEEKEAFSTSVNSPLKPPIQSANKDGTQNNGNANRRTSITQSQNAMNNSPSTRPGARRRESGGDLLQNPLTSPTGNTRFSREEPSISSPPPSLLRRKTDFKDNFGPSLEDREKESTGPGVATASPFGSLRRTSTQPVSAGINGPSSPWSGAPPSAGFSPMGAFGNFAIGSGSSQTPTADEKKPGFGSVRGQSRFKGLMGAGSPEDTALKVKEKASMNSLERLAESPNEPTQAQWANDRTALPRNMHADLYGDEDDFGTGSAALGGDDASPPLPQSSRYRNPDRQTYDDTGFSSLGLSVDMPPFRELMQRRDYAQQQTPQSRHQGMGQSNEPMSPTNTNPYQSPEGEKAIPEDHDTDESDLNNSHYLGAGPFGHAARGFQNQLDAQTGDRSQTSSSSASRGFPSLGGLGDLSSLGGPGAWSAAPGAIGTPSRAQPGFGGAFGDSAFGPLGDLASRSQSGLSGSTLFGAGSTGNINRNSKLSSMLPNAMQDQMRGEASRHEQGFGDGGDTFLRESGHNAPGFGLRDLDTSSRLGRGGMDETFGTLENRGRGPQGLASPFANHEAGQITSSQAPMSASVQTPFSAGPSGGNYFTRSQEQDTSSSQMPASQQRKMVMPDRMRWIYRDPSGNTQGPWSGLEMHDWYKAGFFSPELQVKKLEDADYEPLAQLIRRIGNSREPFLVPQIGIPHGSSAPIPSSTTATAGAVPATTPSAAQPPFASSFPSFGTTLSAEQQNALERRKQEEQYLMARQKEHLAQQQVMLKQMQHMGGVHSQQLHHHSSAHSLQSQPSYGSITSPGAPIGYQPSPGQGPIQPPASIPGFFDGPSRNAGPLGAGADPLSSVREEDLPRLLERLGMGRGSQQPFSDSAYGQDPSHQQHVAAMLQERDRQRREQEQYDLLQRGNDDQRTTAERLEQYHQLRAQEEQQQFQTPGPIGGHVNRQASDLDLAGQQQMHDLGHEYQDFSQQNHNDPEPLSLSEQVQKAAAKQQPASQPQSPWAKVDSGLPQPFPPPQSSSPMPAPTPQRNRQSVADALNAESQTSSQADSVETLGAALAPWAKEPVEGSKGPSLKEIQAIEAKNAAQKEEIAVAARRALAEQERLSQQNQPVAPAPGLPSSANWASSISPAIPTTTGSSPWAKPAAGKPAVATPVAGAKKTLAQIQKEEEARKNRAAAAAAANAAVNANATVALASGKRYADLAGKASMPTPLTSSAAWTTVGASGKAKPPTAPAPSLSTRTASGGIVQPSVPSAKPKPMVTASTKGPGNQQLANQEFQRWTKSALSKGLNPNMNVDDFVSQLLMLPPEADIISDSIYASSQTLDGRRFAEEFVRRRKLADCGVIPDSASAQGFSSSMNSSESKSGGGWSEVAKKGPQAVKEETSSNFKVVAGKKKGGKK
ncbi:MAG: hypothetical protein ALECFALPRED_008381 [Alectoria fallacina]|uniref:GYF domain-containing protein n=1 Tax=Alectoria fallacina TaxID=1903189 RepID=A0A8H3J3C3_9LECA|nr:MAG: hypothetical protein ALECFALPRED_008381 [Alectoria fallacina]